MIEHRRQLAVDHTPRTLYSSLMRQLAEKSSFRCQKSLLIVTNQKLCINNVGSHNLQEIPL